MSGKQFIELLENNAMLDDSIIAELRQQIADSSHKVSAESIAKALVDKGHLTKFQATKLVGQVTAEIERRREKKAQAKKSANDDLGLAPEEELGLADEDDGGAAQPEDEVVMLEAASGDHDEAGGLTPVEDAGGGLTPIGGPQQQVDTARPGLTPLAAQPSPADSGGLEPLGGLGADAHDPFAAYAAPQTQPGMVPMAKPKRETRWDSKLMLGGITALALLVLFGFILMKNLFTAPAEEMWNAAMEDYRGEAYSQSLAKFEKFLKKYPEHDNASEGRVRIVLCKIRVVLSDPQKAMERTKELLPTVESEKAFRVARDELATMLIRVPQGFITKAKNAADMTQKEELANLAEQGMTDLIGNPSWVPSTQRDAIGQDINEANEEIVRVRRTINEDKDLRAAIVEIDKLLDESRDTVAAYGTFKALIDKYPGLERNQDLLEAVQKITQIESGLVKVADEAIGALPAEAAGHTRIVLATRTRSGNGQQGPQNAVAPVLAGGSVYALDAGSGQVLWNRFVGHSTRFHPIRVSRQPDADVLLVEGEQLVRVAAADGKVRWRAPAGQAIVGPVVAGDKIFVPTAGGRIVEVDAESGNSARHVTIPQALSTSPGVPDTRPLIFQPGAHSNLYVLARDSLECRDVYYIGHREGTIPVPPVFLLNHLFVAENVGDKFCHLHVLAVAADDDEGVLKKAQDPIRLVGNVVVPMMIHNNRLLVTTDRAQVQVLEVNVQAEKDKVSMAAIKPAGDEDPLVAYPLADAGGTLWLADNRLAKYRVQVTTKEINLLENLSRGDDFVAPLQLHGDLLIGARRKRGSTGVAISAVHIDQPRRTVWETNVGVPAGRVTVDAASNQIRVISSGAALFEINKEAVASGYSDQPAAVAAASGSLSFTEQIELGDGRIAFFNPADHGRLLVYDPQRSGNPLQIVNLQLGEAQVTCLPVAFGGGLLAPLDNGEIQLIDAASGSNLAAPFMPRLAPNEKLQWRGPATLGAAGEEVVVTNNRRELFRLGLKDKALTQLAKTDLDAEIVSSLAAVGDTIYGVVNAGGSDVIVAIKAADLKVAKEFDMAGERVTWGPVRVGDAVLAITDSNKIRCFEAGQQERWEKPAAAYGKPAGLPLQEGGDYIFASLEGSLWRLAGASGQELSKSELGQPLGAGPVAFAGRLLLCGNDGALHVIPMLAAGS